MSQQQGGSTEVPPTDPPKSEAEGIFLVFSIFLFVAVVGAYFVWINRSKFGFGEKGFKLLAFTPPPARAQYLEARQSSSPSDPAAVENLKKLLMARAVQTVPIIIAVETEGNAVQRLYRKGMLTDDSHERVMQMKSFLDREIPEVQQEAGALVPEWEKFIWQQAIHYHQMLEARAKETGEQGDPVEMRKAAAEQRAARARAVQAETKNAMAGGPPRSPVVTENPEQRAERLAKELIEEEEREKAQGKKNK